MEMTGQCYCGDCQLRFRTGSPPETLTPRRCDCRFCKMQALVYLSDPAGALSISHSRKAALLRYRQGTDRATFHLCGRCGVVLCVTYEAADRLYSAANARCLDAFATLPAATVVSPRRLDGDEKVERWRSLWCPKTTFN